MTKAYALFRIYETPMENALRFARRLTQAGFVPRQEDSTARQIRNRKGSAFSMGVSY